MTIHHDIDDPLQRKHFDLASPPAERFPEKDDDSTEANDEDEDFDDDDEESDEDEEDEEQLEDE